jgi:hypothetical protein
MILSGEQIRIQVVVTYLKILRAFTRKGYGKPQRTSVHCSKFSVLPKSKSDVLLLC